MNRRLTLLFAIAGGAAVGNLYWSQPLLDFIADDLKTDTSSAGLLVTATQIGYALGVLLFVPLGDVVNRRILVPIALLCATAALLASALAPTFAVLLVTLALVGLTTVSGQILVPLAGDLADDSSRGRVVGAVVSGILIGILVSRTVSGLIAGAAGWRAIYVVAAALALVLAVLLYFAIPRLEPRTAMRYPALIASVFSIVRRERAVRWHLVLGGISFAVFTMFWTSLTFLLSAPPFSFGVTAIGLFGLVGLAGAAAAQRAGRLSDRGLAMPTIGVTWALVLVSFVVAGLAADSVVGIVVAIVVLDVAIQGHNITVQSRMFLIDPAARSRLNTAFVTNNFICGAIGSGLATLLWAHGGWTAVTLGGAVLCGVALTVWAVGRRGGLLLRHEGAGGVPAPVASA
ncbi:putative MFS family arabinose efflux permease [Frondihabitans sp. PhB188]|uniref:MFS transporter n=1 Tax=Frondihabitans sp. PhB188 TaxID=2485200 RepID=UPI000F47BE72|nr:MFS transporter [Frondihabitans sp. PhB188]ROQ41578.1 putative MFS family arabinose efflux permease [Frondihabitans sp. PhB188]